MMRVVSQWSGWRKCHSKKWVRQNWRDQCGVDGGGPGVDSRDEGKHTGRNDLLLVKKMLWVDERV